ncbi:MAG: DUF2207 domain-containing protein [Anaerolineae bacterium]|nr:DUF2207 domain-containing protein [Anaerolineae bacterium]
MKRRFWLCLLCCGLLFTVAAQLDKSYRAERFDVDVQAQADGSLHVNETVTFNFVGGPFSYVFREPPTDHTDGVAGIQAGTDGVPWPNGTGPGEVEISGSNPVNVTWHLSPTSDTTQTFDLTYDLLGVVRRGEEADILDFQALPDEYEYAIDSSRVTVHFPPGGRLVAEPDIRAGDATVITEADRVTFDMQNLSPGDPLVVRLAFAPGAFTAAPPVWQAEQESQNSLAWIWFALGAIILGGGTLAFWRAGRPYLWSAPKVNTYLYKPPFELPPALAGYLANHSINWNHGLATLFDLATRGLVEIEQTREKTMFRSAEFTLTRPKQAAGLRPHEQTLMDLLFTDKNGTERESIELSEMSRLITSSRWKEYTDALKLEADQGGFADPAARERQKRLTIWGTVTALLAMPLFVAAFLMSDLFGMWTLITVGAVFLVGIIGLIIAASMSPLSAKGQQYAAAFEPFRRMLIDVARGKADLPDPTYYHAYLPYATAYGQAVQWVKDQAKSDYQAVPEYFRAAEASGAEMAAFIAVIATASSSGGSAGAAAGAAGAGTAGGGASGAG